MKEDLHLTVKGGGISEWKRGEEPGEKGRQRERERDREREKERESTVNTIIDVPGFSAS